MNKKEIEELIKFVSKSGVSEVSLETDTVKITIKNAAPKVIEQVVTAAPMMQMPVQAAPAPAPVAAAPAPAAAPAASFLIRGAVVPAADTLVLTMGLTANDKPNFVNVGDEIKAGQVVCIIEAMKLFNEIESEISGRIVKVLVDNSSPVEYDQPLFLVDPS